MEFVLATLFGASVGVLVEWTSTTRAGKLPSTAVFVIFGVGLVVSVVGSSGGPPVAMVVGLSSLAASILTAGMTWQGHPLLEGAGYWSRVGIAMVRGQLLRNTRDDDPNPGSSDQKR